MIVFEGRAQSAQVIVNGQIVALCQLRVGDVVQFGQTQFQVAVGQAASTVPHMAAPTMYSQPAYQQAAQPFHGSYMAPMNSGLVQMPGTLPMQGPGGQNINIVQQQNNTGIWVLLVVIFACPLMCVGLVAMALLPYTMLAVGIALVIWGFVEKGRYQAWNYQAPTTTLAKIIGGGLMATLGMIWIIAMSTLPSSSSHSTDSNSSHDSSGYSGPQNQGYSNDPSSNSSSSR